MDSTLLAKNVMFIDLLARDELTASADRELDRLSWLVLAERLLVRYSTELGSEVTSGVGVTVIGGVVWITEETGKIETSCVEETFATLGLRSGEEVMLRFIPLPEVVSTVCGRLEVNASENRVVVTKDVTGGELSTKVCVSIVPEIFEFGIVLTDDEGALLILTTIKDVPWEELLGVMLCVDSIFDTPGVSNDPLWTKLVV